MIGNEYSLRDIASLLKLQEQAAKGKGVLNRKNENAIVLIITLKKNQYVTQFYDHIDNDILYWAGQLKLRSVEKKMETGEYEIFVFMRDHEPLPFTFYGRATPIATRNNPLGKSCQTRFFLHDYSQSFFFKEQHPDLYSSQLDEVINASPIGETTRIATIKQRTVQYEYRKEALKLWNNSCAVLGIQKPKILIASHIKPWRVADNRERIDPKNSLILSPLYDKLFDLGVITFKPSNGKIELSTQLDNSDYDRFGINDSRHLSTVPDGTEDYLEYHNKYIFNYDPMKELEIELLTV